MRSSNYLPGPSMALSTLVSITLYAAPALAQRNGNDENQSTNTRNQPAETETANNGDEKTTSEAEASSQTTEKAPESTSENKDGDKTTTSEPEPAQTTSSTSASVAEITGGGQETTGAVESDFPSLTRGFGVPTYPAAAVPPTKDAPFMQQSTLPDGTVFIAVGAILGAFGLAILLWRFIITCMLRRSVKRAAMAQHSANNKASFPAPPAPFYKYTDQGSTMSLSAAGATRNTRRTTRGPVPSSNPSQSNLFFSPTAAAGNPAAGNRGSAFLPSGFYAAGSGSPAPNHGHSISLTNLRPDSRGHYGNASRNTLEPSPPGSPQFAARRDMSTTSLSLNSPPGNQRAPSAYLEDLLADDPGSLPPPHMPAQRQSANLSPKPGSPSHR